MVRGVLTASRLKIDARPVTLQHKEVKSCNPTNHTTFSMLAHFMLKYTLNCAPATEASTKRTIQQAIVIEHVPS